MRSIIYIIYKNSLIYDGIYIRIFVYNMKEREIFCLFLFVYGIICNFLFKSLSKKYKMRILITLSYKILTIYNAYLYYIYIFNLRMYMNAF